MENKNNFSEVLKYAGDYLDQPTKAGALVTPWFYDAKTEVKIDTMTFANTGVVLLSTIRTGGLGNYIKAGYQGANNNRLSSFSNFGNGSNRVGYPTTPVTIEWKPYTINQLRGFRILVDRADIDDTPINIVPESIKEFKRANVVPEEDTYTISKLVDMASPAFDNLIYEDIDSTNVVESILNGIQYLKDEEAQTNDLVMFVTPSVLTKLRLSDKFVHVIKTNEDNTNDYSLSTVIGEFNGVKVVEVPSNRMYSNINILPEGGFAPTQGLSKEVNFIIASRACGKLIKKRQNEAYGEVPPHEFNGYYYVYCSRYDFIGLEEKRNNVYVSLSNKEPRSRYVRADYTFDKATKEFKATEIKSAPLTLQYQGAIIDPTNSIGVGDIIEYTDAKFVQVSLPQNGVATTATINAFKDGDINFSLALLQALDATHAQVVALSKLNYAKDAKQPKDTKK